MTDENIHVGELLKQFIKYWKIYVPIGITCLIGAIVFILVTPKKYDITARMQLLGEQQGMMSELKMLKSSGIGGLLGGGGGGVNTENEILIITSRNNLAEVIRQTEYQVETSTKKNLKNVLFDKEECPISYIFPKLLLDTISAPINIRLNVDDNKIKKATVKSSLFETIVFENQSIPFKMVLPVGTITIIRQLDGNGTFTTQISPLQKVYEDLDKIVYVTPSKTISDIIVLSCEASNKQRACKLLNAIMDRYNQYSRITKVNEANLNSAFVKDRLDSVTLELAILEQQIETYKQINKMPDPGAYSSITYYGNKETEKAILETETRMRMLDYVISYMKKASNAYSAIPIVDGAGEKAIMIYNQLILDRQRLLQSSESNNPALQLVENQLREQRKMLIESVESVRHNIQISLDALYKKDTTLSKQVDKLPTQEREFIEMKRQQKIKESMYLFLMQKLQEKELINSPDEIAGRIIDKAYSSYKPIFPKKSIVLIIAFIITCVLSLVVISFKVFASKKE